MTEKRKPKQEQTDEWFESEVTEYFFSLISRLKETARDALADQGFDTDSSERLMAQRGNLFGIYGAFDDLEKVFLEKSLSELEEEEDGESVGDLPQS